MCSFLKRSPPDRICMRTCVTKKRLGYGVCSVLLKHTYERTRKKGKRKKRSKLLNDDAENDDEKRALYFQSPFTE
jgi:hypothetical protein